MLMKSASASVSASVSGFAKRWAVDVATALLAAAVVVVCAALEADQPEWRLPCGSRWLWALLPLLATLLVLLPHHTSCPTSCNLFCIRYL